MLLRTKCTCAREGNHLLAELRMLLVVALPIILLFVGKKNKSGSIQRNTKQTLSKIHGIFLFHDFTKLFTRLSRRVTILERLSSSPIFSGVSVVPSLVLCVGLCRS